MARALMVQGTGSNVGKSMLVAGLCRAARRRGLSVAPFKPQNMSNNAAITAGGGEIGRAQALQALACGLAPVTDMNPVLLKPETDVGAQIILQGKRLTSVAAGEYTRLKPKLLDAVLQSFSRLKQAHDLVIVEGAGSPAEVNLRKGDIANMGFAQAAGVPVLLVGDIDRGGVIAQIIGTQSVITPEDAALIAGFLVNKFRGDPRLFDDGYRLIEELTGWRGFGVLPWFPDAWKLPAEDALDFDTPRREHGLHLVCLCLSRITNFDDLDPLAQEPGVRLTMLRPGQAIPGDADLVILPGSGSGGADLDFIRAQGWDIDLAAHQRRGGHVLGIGGGYPMLGQSIAAPSGAHGVAPDTPGLGLLDISTTLTGYSRPAEVEAVHARTGVRFRGSHNASLRSEGPDRARPFAHVDGVPEGASSPDGRVIGCNLHGMFRDDVFRAAWLDRFGVDASGAGYDATVETTLDALTDHLEAHLDVDGILSLAR